MTFDTTAHIRKMQPSVTKLVRHFKNKGVEFSPSPDDNGFNNVTFSIKDKIVKISDHSFYRYSGIAYIYKDSDNNSVEAIEVTDEMYLTIFMKPILELLLK